MTDELYELEPWRDKRAAAEVAVFMLMITAFLVVGGCLL
ncbi:hypothetical protein ACUXOC_000235 [Corynebacterium mucifaciens]